MSQFWGCLSCSSGTHWLWVKIIWLAQKQDYRDGTQEGEPLLGEYRSGGATGSHPGIKVLACLQAWGPYSQSQGLRKTGGRPPPGRSTDQVVPGVATLELKFQTCLKAWGPYSTVLGGLRETGGPLRRGVQIKWYQGLPPWNKSSRPVSRGEATFHTWGTEENRRGSASWEEYRSVVPVGSHPGIKVPDLSPGPISHSPGVLRELQPAWSHMQIVSFSMINPLLTKLFQSWQDICLILCFLHVYGPRLHLDPWKPKKHSSSNIQPSWNHAWSITHM